MAKTVHSFGSLVEAHNALDTAAVKLTGTQSIAGDKTFSGMLTVPSSNGASGRQGQVRWNNSLGKFEGHNGSAWDEFGGTGGELQLLWTGELEDGEKVTCPGGWNAYRSITVVVQAGRYPVYARLSQTLPIQSIPYDAGGVWYAVIHPVEGGLALRSFTETQATVESDYNVKLIALYGTY